MAEYTHPEDVEKPDPIISDAVRENVKSRSTWGRFLYMLVLALCFGIAEFLIAIVAIAQFLTTLFTGDVNKNLMGFGRDLSNYVFNISKYMTYNTEDRPFPFSEWESHKDEPD